MIFKDFSSHGHFIKQAQACYGERNTEVLGSLFTKLSTGMRSGAKKSLVYRDLADRAPIFAEIRAASHDVLEQYPSLMHKSWQAGAVLDAPRADFASR